MDWLWCSRHIGGLVTAWRMSKAGNSVTLLLLALFNTYYCINEVYRRVGTRFNTVSIIERNLCDYRSVLRSYVLMFRVLLLFV